MTSVSQKTLLDNLPDELKSCPQWLCVKLEQRGDKPTKVPYCSRNISQRAKVDASSTWGTFDEAVAVFERCDCSGIGVVLTNEMGLTIVDLDHCVEPDGELTPESQKVVDLFDSYTELSQSGSGVHIIVRGELPGKRRRKRGVEMYCSDRYFWLTGDTPGEPKPIESRQAELDLFYASTFDDKPVEKPSPAVPTCPQDEPDDDLLEMIRSSKQGPKFERLWRGDTSEYATPGNDGHSEADEALCSILHWWCKGDLSRVDRLFRMSGLMREKWDSPRGTSTYGAVTMSKVAGSEVRGTNDVTTPAVLPRVDDTFHLTDMGNCERFCAQHGGGLRWCFDLGRWLHWTTQLWEVDKTGEVQRLAKRTVRGMYVQAGETEDSAERKALVDHARRCESRFRLDSLVELAKSEPGIAVGADGLDRDLWLLNCLNGSLDLRSGILHPARQADLCSKSTSVAYVKNAPCPLWLSFLDTIFAGDSELIDWIQKFCGYALTGDVSEQILTIFHGIGANGKSTFVETMHGVMGDYSGQAGVETFLSKRPGSIPNDVARLRGLRFVSASETGQGRRLDEAFVKSATGGDILTARFMRAEYFEFKPAMKIVLSTNHKPQIMGTDLGIWRRIRLIPFNVSIPPDEQDRRLTEKLREEWTGILAWAVRGCLAWQRDGLTPPDAVSSATREYRETEDILGGFIAECCVVGEDLNSSSKLLFHTYTNWCDETGEKPLKRTGFGKRLSERGFLKSRNSKNGRVEWAGVGVLDGAVLSAEHGQGEKTPQTIQPHLTQSGTSISQSAKKRLNSSEPQNNITESSLPRKGLCGIGVQTIQDEKLEVQKTRAEQGKVGLNSCVSPRGNPEQLITPLKMLWQCADDGAFLDNVPGGFVCPICGRKYPENGEGTLVI